MNPPPTATASRSKLDRAAVVDAAVALGDAEGLEAVTIRRLAKELSVTPMALYWHFADKEALLAAVADRLWEEAAEVLDRAGGEAGGGDDGSWAPLRRTIDALLKVMRAHPALAGLVPGRVLSCEAGLAITERALGFLAAQGLSPASAALVARFVLCSTVMLVENQPGGEILELAKRTEAQRVKHAALAALPVDRYPFLTSAAGYLTDCESADEYFDQSVALIVAGARQQAVDGEGV